MAYNLELEHRIEEVTAGWPDMVKRKMFGGRYYLVRGNMGFGMMRS